MASTTRVGRAGERAAERWLVRRGWRVVARNWHGGGGEIDLAVTRRGVLAICEVRLRGDPDARDEPLTAVKRRRVARAAEAYLAAHPPPPGRGARLDVLVVEPAWPFWRVRHLPGAFDAPRSGPTPGRGSPDRGAPSGRRRRPRS